MCLSKSLTLFIFLPSWWCHVMFSHTAPLMGLEKAMMSKYCNALLQVFTLASPTMSFECLWPLCITSQVWSWESEVCILLSLFGVRNWSSPFTQSLSITGLWLTLIFSHILFLASSLGIVRCTIPAMLSLNFPWVSTPHSSLSPNLNYFCSSWGLQRLKMLDLCSPRWWHKPTQHGGFFRRKGWMRESTTLILQFLLILCVTLGTRSGFRMGRMLIFSARLDICICWQCESVITHWGIKD